MNDWRIYHCGLRVETQYRRGVGFNPPGGRNRVSRRDDLWGEWRIECRLAETHPTEVTCRAVCLRSFRKFPARNRSPLPCCPCPTTLQGCPAPVRGQVRWPPRRATP